MSMSRLQSLVSRTSASATSLLSKGVSVAEVQYNGLMTRNAEYVIKDSKQEALLLRQWFFTKLSKLPGILKEAPIEAAEWRQVWNKRTEWTVDETAVRAVFALEVFAWFCLGEIVGRGGTLTGYYF